MRAKQQLAREAARFIKFVEWSEEDQCFIGRCPSLFFGGVHDSDEAAVYAQLCEVTKEWIALLGKEGGQIQPQTTLHEN